MVAGTRVSGETRHAGRGVVACRTTGDEDAEQLLGVSAAAARTHPVLIAKKALPEQLEAQAAIPTAEVVARHQGVMATLSTPSSWLENNG